MHSVRWGQFRGSCEARCTLTLLECLIEEAKVLEEQYPVVKVQHARLGKASACKRPSACNEEGNHHHPVVQVQRASAAL